ncbi:MAG: class I SAM-dependent methyltransferase [Acidimicrobiales bacterium]
MDTHGSPWPELAFLVPPDEVQDWRMVLLLDAAVDNGLLDALPGSAEGLAAELGLDPHATGVVLDGLALWDIVVVDDDGGYAPGPAAPDAEATAVLRHHARAIRGWSTIDERVRGVAPDPNRMTPGGVEIMLDALAVMGRASAPDAVHACLAQAPDAASVLDLGGGHGQFAAEFARRGLRTVMQDRPAVVDLARSKGWLDGTGVELFGGDFFDTLPDERFDIVFCAGVVYTMDGERVVRLLRQVRPLIAPGGHLAVHTFLRGTDELATLFSAQMLGNVAGGQSHGEDDLRRWFDEAGYRNVSTRPLDRRPEWMLFAEPSTTTGGHP